MPGSKTNSRSASRTSLEDLSPKAADVTARLTDPKGYTGTHKQRFDEEGNGRGLVGRHDIVTFDGSTSSLHRDHTVKSDTDLRGRVEGEKPIVHQKSKQDDIGYTAKKIKLYEYAEKHEEGEDLVLNKTFPTMDTLRAHAAQLLPAGKPKVILDQSLHEVQSLDQISDGGKYLAITPYDRANIEDGRIPLRFRE
ncbi:hypothetical protein HK097_011456 [Rhizophlyctis rosea]|uniref:Uncharacterized protein n=1 Tax=Rhizophlyctis rosea TaxID=64517 RepID=A0AAD5S8S2_9FUNG|nr:hypothetical protein HK097_011456 [Rhizophlyctis rosea]